VNVNVNLLHHSSPQTLDLNSTPLFDVDVENGNASVDFKFCFFWKNGKYFFFFFFSLKVTENVKVNSVEEA
jgi:hypothetical protein